MSGWHVVCRDCTFEGVAPSEQAADDAVEAHLLKNDEHTVTHSAVADPDRGA